MPKPASPRRKAAKTQPAPPDVPAFIRPQLCTSTSNPPSGNDWLSEAKIDGYRIQLNTEGPSPILRTRKGLDWTKRFPAVAEAARKLPPAIIDGELAALDTAGTPDFPGLQAAMAEGRSEHLTFFAFDLLFDGTRGFALPAPPQTQAAPQDNADQQTHRRPHRHPLPRTLHRGAGRHP